MKVKESKKKLKEENLNKIENNKIKANMQGITLIALVVTIIVLLILARNINFDVNWRKWDFK